MANLWLSSSARIQESAGYGVGVRAASSAGWIDLGGEGGVSDGVRRGKCGGGGWAIFRQTLKGVTAGLSNVWESRLGKRGLIFVTEEKSVGEDGWLTVVPF